VGLLKNPIRVTPSTGSGRALNEVKGLLTLVESASRRFFAVLRTTERTFFNSPAATCWANSAGRRALLWPENVVRTTYIVDRWLHRTCDLQTDASSPCSLRSLP
jgi:hypothetical protein